MENSRAQYTWNRNGVYEKLDWVLCNWEWRVNFSKVVVDLLPYTRSDHRSLLLKMRGRSSQRVGDKICRYQITWLTDTRFSSFFNANWNTKNNFVQELNSMTGKLQQWNHFVFGNIF